MSNQSVIACVLGADPQRVEARTVGELRTKMNLSNHTAMVNGDTVDDDYTLDAEDFVSFAPAVKGG